MERNFRSSDTESSYVQPTPGQHRTELLDFLFAFARRFHPLTNTSEKLPQIISNAIFCPTNTFCVANFGTAFLINFYILGWVHPQSLHLSSEWKPRFPLRSFELHILGLCKPSRLQCFLATKHLLRTGGTNATGDCCLTIQLFGFKFWFVHPKIIRKIWSFFSEKVLECKVCILVLVGQVEMLLTFLKLLLLLLFFLLGGSHFFCFSRFFVMAMLRTRNRGLVQENKKNKTRCAKCMIESLLPLPFC